MSCKTIECDAFEQLINDFCRRITPDFERLLEAFQKVFPDASPQTRAQLLMEFGRGQISEIEVADEDEKRVVQTTIDSLSFEYVLVAWFHAYASGCVMGLVSKKELPGPLIVSALEIAALFAFQNYAPEILQSGIRPNALLGFAGKTAWETIKGEHQTIPWEIQ